MLIAPMSDFIETIYFLAAFRVACCKQSCSRKPCDSCLKKKDRAYFALSIRTFPIEPLLSRRKMYYPLALSISHSKSFPSSCILTASLICRLQHFGIKDTAAQKLMSVRPRIAVG